MNFQALRIGGGLSALHGAGSDALLVLAHGAGAGHDHHHMNSIAETLARVGIGTLRFNFPFIEGGRRRVDKPEVCLQAFDEAITVAASLSEGMPLLMGGHSFGGRMATHYAAEKRPAVGGVVCFSFPLHPAKKPATKRAAHLPEVTVPMLFLSGTRDNLANPALMTEVTDPLPEATVHWLDTGDHSFKILKRSRESTEDIYDEAARVAKTWLSGLE